jgi:malonyl-CoA O-methyltransferase
MPALSAELALPEVAQSRRRFDRAAPSFASASFIHDEARRNLIARLAGLRVVPGTVLDLGAGLGSGAAALGEHYPGARVIAVDSSREMLRRAVSGDFGRIVGDVGRLPLPAASADLLFANLVLPWTRPEALFAEARRVLKPEGVLVFSTLGPDTLMELRQAWRKADDAIHVHAFWDMQTLGDLAVRAGLEEPVLDVDRIRVSYTELSHVIRDLRACGSTNTAAGRRRGLTGRGRWHRFAEALWEERQAGGKQRLHLTVELIFGQAFGSHIGRQETAGGEVAVPVEHIRRSRGSSRADT